MTVVSCPMSVIFREKTRNKRTLASGWLQDTASLFSLLPCESHVGRYAPFMPIGLPSRWKSVNAIINSRRLSDFSSSSASGFRDDDDAISFVPKNPSPIVSKSWLYKSAKKMSGAHASAFSVSICELEEPRVERASQDVPKMEPGLSSLPSGNEHAVQLPHEASSTSIYARCA